MIMIRRESLHTIHRREFLKQSASGIGMMMFPGFIVGSSKEISPSDRMNIAIIGVAGRGHTAVLQCQSQNVIALCDVDEDRIIKMRSGKSKESKGFNAALTMYEKRGAKWYFDYRSMFEKIADKIDAVIISTPDHMHFPIALSAINQGKHVYCQAPLTHTVEETRILAMASKDKGVILQMGIQGGASAGRHQIREWIQAGLIGDIREVHSWTSRSAIWWRNCVPSPGMYTSNHRIPAKLKWEQWLGIAAPRPYSPDYLAGRWKTFRDFGNGVLGNMGCQIMDAAYWGLDLNVPEKIESSTILNDCYPVPVSSIVQFKFPARENIPPVTYYWYEGMTSPLLTEVFKEQDIYTEDFPFDGSLIIGNEGMILSDPCCTNVRIFKINKFEKLKKTGSLKRQQPDMRNYDDFFSTIREGKHASSGLKYSRRLTETVLLGSIAQSIRKNLDYDEQKGIFIRDDQANRLMKKGYRDGWILS